jgi:hypothetical protein
MNINFRLSFCLRNINPIILASEYYCRFNFDNVCSAVFIKLPNEVERKWHIFAICV